MRTINKSSPSKEGRGCITNWGESIHVILRWLLHQPPALTCTHARLGWTVTLADGGSYSCFKIVANFYSNQCQWLKFWNQQVSEECASSFPFIYFFDARNLSECGAWTALLEKANREKIRFCLGGFCCWFFKDWVTRKAQQSCRQQLQTPSLALVMLQGELIQTDNREDWLRQIPLEMLLCRRTGCMAK